MCTHGGRSPEGELVSVYMEEGKQHVYTWRKKSRGGAREWIVYTKGMFLHLSIVLPTINFPISEGTLSWSDHWQ